LNSFSNTLMTFSNIDLMDMMLRYAGRRMGNVSAFG
jgi:hypothetical protein